MNTQTVTLIASLLAFVSSFLNVVVGIPLTLRKERRQLLWSKELEQFFAVEELAGQLVEGLASHGALDQAKIGPRLQELQHAAGRLARYDCVRRVTLQLEGRLNEMYVAKTDRADDKQELGGKLDLDLKQLREECDKVTGRGKLHRGWFAWFV